MPNWSMRVATSTFRTGSMSSRNVATCSLSSRRPATFIRIKWISITAAIPVAANARSEATTVGPVFQRGRAVMTARSRP